MQVQEKVNKNEPGTVGKVFYEYGPDPNADPEGEESKMIPINKYIWGPQLGRGGYAKVYQVQHSTTKRIYACKVVSKENLEKESSQKKLSNEIKIHSELVHQNIVKFHKHFNDN